MNFRFATANDCDQILDFIQQLAAYEHIIAITDTFQRSECSVPTRTQKLMSRPWRS